MVFAARVAEVVIATPDDTEGFRPAISQALNWWNAASGQRHEIVLMPLGDGHRTGGAERLNPSAESAQTVDSGDVFIAVFDPARRDVAQVMGAVDRAQRAGKLVLAWLLAESPSSHGLSADDQAWLGDVAHRLSKAGIVPRYLGQRDAHFESRLQTAITDDLTYRNLGKLASGFEKACQVPQLRIYRTPVALLGPQIWAVTVVNHGVSLVVGLQVSVAAADSEGRARPGGAKRSRQAIADVVAKLRAGPWPDEHHPLCNPRGVLPAQQPIFLGTRMDLLAAHNVVDFPRWLRPNQHASALYSLEPNASPTVRITFEDEAGEVWSRANEAEPERVSSTSRSSGEFRASAGAGE
jgi:hypothetical protein